MDTKELQKMIILEMQKKKMSYGALSVYTGISKSTLQRYVTGTTSKIPMTAIQSIEQALNMKPGKLMGWDSDERKDCDALSDTEKNLLTTFKKLSSSGKEKVLDYTTLIYNSEKTQ